MAGVVLAGGLGRRMGRDKTGLRLREGEADFISRAAALLARVVVDVRVGCRADQAERAARAGRPLTPDLTPGGGCCAPCSPACGIWSVPVWLFPAICRF